PRPVAYQPAEITCKKANRGKARVSSPSTACPVTAGMRPDPGQPLRLTENPDRQVVPARNMPAGLARAGWQAARSWTPVPPARGAGVQDLGDPAEPGRPAAGEPADPADPAEPAEPADPVASWPRRATRSRRAGRPGGLAPQGF